MRGSRLRANLQPHRFMRLLSPKSIHTICELHIISSKLRDPKEQGNQPGSPREVPNRGARTSQQQSTEQTRIPCDGTSNGVQLRLNQVLKSKRIPRGLYWLALLVWLLVLNPLLVFGILHAFGYESLLSFSVMWLVTFANIALLVVLVARRLHDIGCCGAWMLALLPVATILPDVRALTAMLALIGLGIVPGTKKENKYGKRLCLRSQS